MNAMIWWAAGNLGTGWPLLLLLIAKATVVLAVGWTVHASLSGRNPRWRVGLWRSVTVGLLVICGLAIAPPFWTWRLAWGDARGEASRAQHESIAAGLDVAPRRDLEAAHAVPAARTLVEPARVREPRPVVQSDDATDRVAGLADAREGIEYTRAQIVSWLIVVWIVGVAAFAARLAAGAWRLTRVIGRSTSAPEWMTDVSRALAGRLGVAREIRVLRSAEVLTPCLTGLARRVILIPDLQCECAARADLEAIFAHELAHARTHDLAWNMAVNAISLLLWFHPLAWRVRAAHAAACDLVCDSVAAGLIGDVTSYCRTLARLALGTARRPAHGLAMARTSDVSRRIAFLHRNVFPALSEKLMQRARIAVGLIAVLAGGLGFTRQLGGEALGEEPGWPGFHCSLRAKPGLAEKRTLEAAPLAEQAISPYELSVAGSGDPAGAPGDLVAILGDSRLKMQWQVLDLVFTHDGRSLIGAGDQGRPLQDVLTGMQQRVLLEAHTDSGRRAWPDKLRIAAGTLVSGSNDTTVKVWDLVSGKDRLTLKGHQRAISSLALSRDGTQIASGDRFAQVRLWSSGDGRELKVLEGHQRSVLALAFNRDGSVLASAGDDGAIQLWDTASGRSVKTLSQAGERWQALAFSPDGKTLAAGGYDHGLVLWDAIPWTARPARCGGRWAVCDFAGLHTGGGRRLALVLGFAARIVDAQTGEVVQQFPKQPVGINRIALGRDDATLAMSGWGVSFWDVAGGGETTPQLSGHHAGVESLAFSSGGEQLATASADGMVKLWDLAERKERLTLRAHANYAKAVAFRPDGRALATLGFDPELCLWELPSGKELPVTFKGAGDVSEKVFFSPDGRWLAAVALSRLRGNLAYHCWTSKPAGSRV